MINAEPRAALSLPAPVSFPSLINKRHVSRLSLPPLWFSLSSPPPWSAAGGPAFDFMAWQVRVDTNDKSRVKLGTGTVSGLKFCFIKASLLSRPPAFLGVGLGQGAQTQMPPEAMGSVAPPH